MLLIHTLTHQRRLAAMQGADQLVRSIWGLGVLLRDTLTQPGRGIELATLRLPDDCSYCLSPVTPFLVCLHTVGLIYQYFCQSVSKFMCYGNQTNKFHGFIKCVGTAFFISAYVLCCEKVEPHS
ncbi:hypothetical protein COCON_G00235340 [Conger conger]|uniref:Uncharacterized protein n=1 Tax=Conger conger TaxID=82655 RepID=A0A9Q1CUV4_CONCO|nr:hypothetical protein COCON_G00235340 [Conger conger]